MKCLYCGKEFEPTGTSQKYCSPQCGKAYRSKIPQPMSKERTLDDWVREANECNLDYGTYRALIKIGRTYEELKETADRRRFPTHSHVHARKHE